MLLLISCSVVSDSFWSHGLQHTRLPCHSESPGVCSNSCPLSRWCHPTISFSVIPFSSCLQSFPASGSFLMSRVFPSGGQSIGASASASVLPIDFLYNWLVWSPCCPRDSQDSSPTPQFKSINSSVLTFLYGPTLTFIHDYCKKTRALKRRAFVSKRIYISLNLSIGQTSVFIDVSNSNPLAIKPFSLLPPLSLYSPTLFQKIRKLIPTIHHAFT